MAGRPTAFAPDPAAAAVAGQADPRGLVRLAPPPLHATRRRDRLLQDLLASCRSCSCIDLGLRVRPRVVGGSGRVQGQSSPGCSRTPSRLRSRGSRSKRSPRPRAARGRLGLIGLGTLLDRGLRGVRELEKLDAGRLGRARSGQTGAASDAGASASSARASSRSCFVCGRRPCSSSSRWSSTSSSTRYRKDVMDGLRSDWRLAQVAMGFFASGLIVTLLYRWLPTRRVPWKAALAGGWLTALLWEAGEAGAQRVPPSQRLRTRLPGARFGARPPALGLLRRDSSSFWAARSPRRSLE